MTFNKLPHGWNEAPHFGNAMVGSMLYQADDTLRLQVFRADVHDHRDDTWGWTAYSGRACRSAHFALHPVGKLTGCQWRKDLWNAELTGTITTDRGRNPHPPFHTRRWTWRSSPSSPRTKARKDATGPGIRPRRARRVAAIQPPRPGSRSSRSNTARTTRDTPSSGSRTRPAGWKNTATLRCGSRTFWPAANMPPHGPNRSDDETRTHIVSIANSYPADRAAAAGEGGRGAVPEAQPHKLGADHRDWWHAYYPRSFVTLPDKSLESLYWQTIYRYGCTTRAGRCFVDTPGIWFQGKSWPYFTTDWNIQSAHWPVYAANRLEQGQALVDRLHRSDMELIKAVRPVEWQEDSAYLPIAVAWDMAGTREGDMRYYDLVGNLPWAMHNLWMAIPLLDGRRAAAREDLSAAPPRHQPLPPHGSRRA